MWVHWAAENTNGNILLRSFVYNSLKVRLHNDSENGLSWSAEEVAQIQPDPGSLIGWSKTRYSESARRTRVSAACAQSSTFSNILLTAVPQPPSSPPPYNSSLNGSYLTLGVPKTPQQLHDKQIYRNQSKNQMHHIRFVGFNNILMPFQLISMKPIKPAAWNWLLLLI